MSCGGASESSSIDPEEKERIRNETWIRAAGGKFAKGHIYSIGQLTYSSNYVDKLIYHGSSSLTFDSQDFVELKQQVQTYKEFSERLTKSNERLTQQVQSLINVVQTLLSPDAWIVFQQKQEQYQPLQHERGSQENNEDQNQDQHKDEHPPYPNY